MGDIVITYTGDIDPAVEGGTFQIHALPGNRLRLIPVEIVPGGRCPVLIKGEQCGLKQGHEGPHKWGNGD